MDLTYLICRAHGFETKLLTAEHIRELMAVNSLKELVERLSQTGYGPKLRDAKNIWDLERIFAEELMDKFHRLLGISPEGVLRDFLKTYFRRYEVQNLIWLIRMKWRKASEEEVKSILLPTERIGDVKFEPLIKLESLEELFELLENQGYQGIAAFGEDISLIECALRKIHYQRLMERLSRIILADRRDIRSLLIPEIDLSNLKLCIITLLHNYDEDTVRKLLIKNPGGISLRELLASVKMGDIRKFIESFPNYRAFLETVLSGEEWKIDVEQLRVVRKALYLKRVERYISFLYVMKYIIDVETEYRNLRSIALSIYHNLPVEAREELVILP